MSYDGLLSRWKMLQPIVLVNDGDDFITYSESEYWSLSVSIQFLFLSFIRNVFTLWNNFWILDSQKLLLCESRCTLVRVCFTYKVDSDPFLNYWRLIWFSLLTITGTSASRYIALMRHTKPFSNGWLKVYEGLKFVCLIIAADDIGRYDTIYERRMREMKNSVQSQSVSN